MRYRSKPTTEVEAMRWHRAEHRQTATAEQIVAWVNANGGEARYEPEVVAWAPRSVPKEAHVGRSAHIAVRTINGWRYAAPGHYIVMGSEWFDVAVLPTEPIERRRDFYPVADLSQVRHVELTWEPKA